MAVTFKTDESYGFKLMSLFGVSASMIVAAKNMGVTVSQATPGTFIVGCGGEVFGSVTIKGQAITAAKAGTLGPSSKMAVCMQFETALKKVVGGGAAVLTPQPDSAGPSLELDTTSNKSKIVKNTAAVGTVSKPGYYLHQKVPGTSAGSVYEVFALFGDLALAGRVKNGVLSIRTMGTSGLALYEATLTQLGFTSKKGAYLSAHYSCGDPSLVKKTVGAVVGALGFNNCTGVAPVKAE